MTDHQVLQVVSTPSQRMINESRSFLQQMNVYHKWTRTKGKGIKIGVIDTGVDINHKDLKRSVKGTYNSFNHSNDVTDRQGHGTHCAGIIFGDGLIHGVAPEAELYVIKSLGDDGYGSNDSIVNGILWCIKQGVDVISMSLGSNYPSPGIEKAINEAEKRGVVCVCAAGNDGNGRHDLISIDWPGAYKNTIAVGAIDRHTNIAYFSSIGNVDVVAYGVDILSTYPQNRYAILSGTSMATPYIAGCIGLIQANAKNRLKRKLTLDEIKMLLILNAQDLGSKDKDSVYGYGHFKF